MTIPFWCLFIMVLLPYALSSLGGLYRWRKYGYYENKHPREQVTQLEGLGSRIYAAQQNTWEALPVFAISVFVAHLSQANVEQSALLSILFVMLRISYGVVYIFNLDKLRTLIFTAAFGCCLGLFYLAIVAT
ncbi:MAG TPA: MAPEG family protein [Gammaproteobacteria bacterium]|nr:MAPEG family protein [Gammaproteobacteria bacterium]